MQLCCCVISTFINIIQIMHDSESDIQMMNPRLKMSHDGADRVLHFQPRVIIFGCGMTNYELLR